MQQTGHDSRKTDTAWAEILTTAEMRAVEQAAIASSSVTGLELMARAGHGAADTIRARWPAPGRAVVLCGPGNNGGDGFVVAHWLRECGWRVWVGAAVPPDRLPPDAAAMCARWLDGGGRLHPLTPEILHDADFRPDLVIDAVFGTGLTRPPAGDLAAVLAETARLGAQDHKPVIISLDGPSGLDLDSGYPLTDSQPVMGAPRIPLPDLTIAFHSLKPGHLIGDGPEYCGKVEVIDIGLPGPHRAKPVTAEGLAGLLTKRRGHKFSHGHALIVAGGIAHGGAARLSARAALRTGAGLVTLAPPKSALIEHGGAPDALMRRGVDDAGALAALLDDPRITSVALGPGCGTDRAAALLDPLLASHRATVLDADALTALAARGTHGLHDRCILTPHAGEFARLFPDLAARLDAAQSGTPGFGKLDAAREAAARCGATVLLKGPDTVIAAPDGQARIHSAYDIPWLATAGAGDVLTGIIAGLLARNLAPLDAAATGAFLHAQAARRFGPGLIADDLPDQLPAVFRDLGL